MGGGLLGSKTGDFLTWVTIVLVAVFLTLAVLMGRFYRPQVGDYGAGDVVAAEQPVTEGEGAGESETAAPVDVNAGADANSAGG
jgi:preprotein translocase subunit SecG